MNGRPIIVAGANRHEHDDVGGKVVPFESMVRDAVLMKRFNFNAVRTSHYPNHPFFYEVRRKGDPLFFVFVRVAITFSVFSCYKVEFVLVVPAIVWLEESKAL